MEKGRGLQVIGSGLVEKELHSRCVNRTEEGRVEHHLITYAGRRVYDNRSFL